MIFDNFWKSSAMFGKIRVIVRGVLKFSVKFLDLQSVFFSDELSLARGNGTSLSESLSRMSITRVRIKFGMETATSSQ